MTRARVPLAIAPLGALLVWLAPAERTLGDGIRWVYAHVGLVWAGGAELVMHPRDPVRTATSSAIQWTFALAFAVAAALTAWMIAALGARSRTR